MIAKKSALPPAVARGGFPAGRNVALLIETSKAYGRGVLRGISHWQREHEPWSVYADERGFDEDVPKALKHWRVDGVITRLQRHRLPAAWQRDDLPMVSLSWEDSGGPSPGVHTDEAAIARAAADHLLDQGFRQLAFCGVHAHWSQLREAAFTAHAADRGATVHVFDAPKVRRVGMSLDQVPAIARWIASLPRPLGVMAANDVKSLEVLDAVRSLGMDCPDDVAVVGVDNDEVLCELASPNLSSVAQNLECIGYEAARMLTDLMDGKAATATSVLVPPLGVIARRSSDMLAIDDPGLRVALRLIRAKACDGLTADQVATVSRRKRRVLERQFVRTFGRSLHEEIVRTRLLEARRLLDDSRLKLEAIAGRCNFAHAAQMCTVFKKAFGMTPTEHRRRARPWTESDGP